jgi:hypothetical protein
MTPDSLLYTVLYPFLEKGVGIEMSLNKEGEVLYVLDSQTKSGIYIVDRGDHLDVTGRYGEYDSITTTMELLYIATNRFMSKPESGFGNPVLLEMAEDAEMLQRKEHVTYTYEYS